MASSRIVQEIQQTQPFTSIEQEVGVAFMKTADHLRRSMATAFEAHGVTQQQFNVLRILRGAGKAGLPTLSVAERLVEHTPGITRLIDRLEAKDLVRRERPAEDRRQVYCYIAKDGLALLGRLDGPVAASSKRAFAGLKKAEMTTLLEILEKIRDAEGCSAS